MKAQHAAQPDIAESGFTAAVRATRERACMIIDEQACTYDRAAADRVIRRINEPGTRFDDDLRGDLNRVVVAELEDHGPLGWRAVPLLVVADELVPHWRDRNIDLQVFADALTALTVACHRGSPTLDGVQHVMHAVREFLAARPQPLDPALSVPRDLLTTEIGRRGWESLVAQVPWLRWWAPEDLDPRRAEPVGPAELVDLLVLLRPCVEQRFVGDTPVDRPLPERFTRLYQSEAPVGTATLERLADALGSALDQPSRAAKKLDALSGLPPALHTAAHDRVQAELTAVTDLANVLAVRVDPRHVVVANLSTRHRLEQTVGGHEVVLSPKAVEEHGAAGYCSEALVVGPGVALQEGHDKVTLDVPMAPMAERATFTSASIPPDVFRGRELELATLRMSIQTRGPRTGNLIFGPRRAGKSTLMEYVAHDSRLRGAVSVDLSSTVDQVHNFAEWNRQATRNLTRAIGRQLKWLSFDTEGVDVLETLIDLDQALDGGAPVAVALDELDVLMTPEQGSDGRHMANRLGNQVFENLVVMGTVQRFHRSVHEFKNWQTVECAADLSWADGVTYFFGPLHDPREGPRVEWLDRVGVTPRLFADEIAPVIGLRPYFWGQLRSKMESVVRADPARSRLADVELVRSTLARIVTEDSHLNQVMEDGEGLTPAERRRRDLFSVEERRILRRFAEAERPGTALSVAEAERIGGRTAVEELIDRAYVSFDPARGRLSIAVRVYEDFLRSRLSVLREVTPDEPGPPAPERRATAPRPTTTRTAAARPDRTLERPAVRTEGATQPTSAGSGASDPAGSGRSVSGAAARPPKSAAPAAPATRDNRTVPARPPTDKRPPEPPRRGSAGSATPPRPPRTGESAGSPPPRPASSAATSSNTRARATRSSAAKPVADPARSVADCGEPTAAELRRITVILRAELADRSAVPLAEAGPLINQAVPRISAANRWAGAGRLTDFFALHLPEFELNDGASGRVVRLARGRVRRFLDRLVAE